MSGINGILLDIEGTTSSISFVYDVMFPYVREHLDAYLTDHWKDPALQGCLPQLAKDLDRAGDLSQQDVSQGVASLMDADVKSTGLKQLQGLVWKAGFENGELVAHLYDDVAPALKRWNAAGFDVRIYSSGSVQAQKLFFGHTESGNLLSLLNRHYDTTSGPKQDAVSYQAIASDFGLPANRILFVSDVVAELDAANEAGMQTALSIRPGNKPIDDDSGHKSIESFVELDTLYGLV